ncbi:MAG: hypothetical protein IIC50_11825 [Planctomycetes bacterium]|nr:hypothetical protein [Planctomycetota bacterium]
MPRSPKAILVFKPDAGMAKDSSIPINNVKQKTSGVNLPLITLQINDLMLAQAQIKLAEGVDGLNGMPDLIAARRKASDVITPFPRIDVSYYRQVVIIQEPWLP